MCQASKQHEVDGLVYLQVSITWWIDFLALFNFFELYPVVSSTPCSGKATAWLSKRHVPSLTGNNKLMFWFWNSCSDSCSDEMIIVAGMRELRCRCLWKSKIILPLLGRRRQKFGRFPRMMETSLWTRMLFLLLQTSRFKSLLTLYFLSTWVTPPPIAAETTSSCYSTKRLWGFGGAQGMQELHLRSCGSRKRGCKQRRTAVYRQRDLSLWQRKFSLANSAVLFPHPLFCTSAKIL
jgi:hypothetical protein